MLGFKPEMMRIEPPLTEVSHQGPMPIAIGQVTAILRHDDADPLEYPVRSPAAILVAQAELEDALQTEPQMIRTIRDGDTDDKTRLDHPTISVDQGLLLAEQGLVNLQPAGEVLVTGHPHQGLDTRIKVIVTTAQVPGPKVTQVRGSYLQELRPFRGQPEQTGNGGGCHGCRPNYRNGVSSLP